MHSRHTRVELNIPPIKLEGSQVIPYSPSAKNLGVTFDSTLSMDGFINQKSKAAWYHLRNIGKIRPYLTAKSIEQLVHAFVTTNIDYCNSLLSGLPSTQLSKLQRIQNSAARLITRTPKRSSITPVLRHLHWLPVEHRVTFKVLLIVFRALTTGSPSYIRDCLLPHQPSRRLRSSDKNLLVVPTSRTKSYGDRSFQTFASYQWNSLPQSIRSSQTISSFKSKLKPHLFSRAFPDDL